MRKIAIYGKGGIGKSITTQNTVAGLANMGYKVMVVGCDSKADSTRLLLGRFHRKIVLNILREGREDLHLEDICKTGWGGTLCVESGGPDPGLGCAGRGILTSIGLLEQLRAYDDAVGLDYIFYDGIGDMICSGFTMPVREHKVEEIYIITSGEIMAMYATNKICQVIQKYAKTSDVRLGGLIGNAPKEDTKTELIQILAEKLGTQIIYSIPRDNMVQRAEFHGKTVIEYAPSCEQAQHYRNLAVAINQNTNFVIPKSISSEGFEQLMVNFQLFD